MNTTDIHLFETGTGGDFAILNDDLLMSETLHQQVYLALFGGNVEANTKASYLESEERFDYWGNSFIWSDAPTKQFNSETERVLGSVALNSSGRLSILQAASKDLDYLKNVINYTVDVSINSISKMSISISFTEKSNQQNRLLQLVWDNSKKEVLINKII
jgi:phage gp46-like protein